jgi:hypothetical protein
MEDEVYALLDTALEGKPIDLDDLRKSTGQDKDVFEKTNGRSRSRYVFWISSIKYLIFRSTERSSRKRRSGSPDRRRRSRSRDRKRFVC